MSIVSKCIAWNFARYEQVYNYDLAVKLLLEETKELFDAKEGVDKLDAIGDITFVAIGVLWKLGFSEKEITAFFYDAPLTTLSLYELHNHMQYVMEHIVNKLQNSDADNFGDLPGAYLACVSVFVTAIGTLASMGLQHEFYTIVNIICDSNNTKACNGITDPSVKANIVKGNGYIPPTAWLRAVLNSIH